ncbi:hypothetical protein [Prosthecomicrobium sp. N25]|uniref:hypothetical protein n=1 Tax=Prosthecomicrobium sp. N25 TaxID=3129254 RepID=UPI003078330E
MSLPDALAAEADAAIAAMREAARAARRLHARAELLRHMVTTAAKVARLPRAEAVEAVVREWTAAWHLDRTAWPHLARPMEAFTAACIDHVLASPGKADAADTALRAALSDLDDALAEAGTSLADQMAWRSECAHGWWDWIEPTPPDLPGRRERTSVPQPVPGRPFWEAGCADFCKPAGRD